MKRNVAFSLVEVTLALGVAGFCLLAVFGLIPVGINLNKAAAEQAAAMNVSSALIADARATPTAFPVPVLPQPLSVRYGIPLPTAVATGSAQTRQVALYLTESGEKVASANDARYLAVVTLTGPAPSRLDATQMHVLLTWPAQANSGLSTTATTNGGDLRANLKNFTGSTETTAALNRN